MRRVLIAAAGGTAGLFAVAELFPERILPFVQGIAVL